MGKTGKAVVHLVFDSNYQVVGVASANQIKYGTFTDGPVTVVGPVVIGESIDWDQVTEEQYGPGFTGEQMHEYIYMKDGVPPAPLSSYEDYGLKT